MGPVQESARWAASTHCGQHSPAQHCGRAWLPLGSTARSKPVAFWSQRAVCPPPQTQRDKCPKPSCGLTSGEPRMVSFWTSYLLTLETGMISQKERVSIHERRPPTTPHRLYPNKATNVWSFSWQRGRVLITPLPAPLPGARGWKAAPYLIPRCFWCGWSSACTAPTTTCYPPWESRTQAALVRSYRLSYWLTKPRVSRKNKHEQRLQCMGQSAGSFSIWPWWSYSHGRLSFPCAIIYHNFEGQREKQTYNFSIGYIH